MVMEGCSEEVLAAVGYPANLTYLTSHHPFPVQSLPMSPMCLVVMVLLRLRPQVRRSVSA
jgi:hypothetical protein